MANNRENLLSIIQARSEQCNSSFEATANLLMSAGRYYKFGLNNAMLLSLQQEHSEKPFQCLKTADEWKKLVVRTLPEVTPVKIFRKDKNNETRISIMYDITQTSIAGQYTGKYIESFSDNEKDEVKNQIENKYFQDSDNLENMFIGAMFLGRFHCKLSEKNKKMLKSGYDSFLENNPNAKVTDVIQKAHRTFISDKHTIRIEPKKKQETKKFRYKKEFSEKNKQDKELIQQLKKEVSCLDIARYLGYQPVKSGKVHYLQEHDSLVIWEETNSFNWFSRDVGGSNVDLLMHLGNLSLRDAINKLKEIGENSIPVSEELQQETEMQPEPVPVKEETKKMVLPIADTDNSSICEYLNEIRCINGKLIKNIIAFKDKNKQNSYMYQDELRNVVFVGRDKSGEDLYATKRSSMSMSHFKGNVKNSRNDIGWGFHNPKSDKLYICESAIDLLSLMHKKKDYEVKEGNYLSIGGATNLNAISHFLDENLQVKRVFLVFDNDEAGRIATRKAISLIEKRANVKVADVFVPTGKDLNEDLQNEIRSAKLKGIIKRGHEFNEPVETEKKKRQCKKWEKKIILKR